MLEPDLERHLVHLKVERRLAPRTPIPGVYLCGAATHPGGSVIGINGRNAAMAVLADTAERVTHHPSPDRSLRTVDTLG